MSTPRVALDRFSPVVRAWFSARFGEPTEVQARGWERIAGGEHTLMLAPTGSGKTLAAFLWALDRLVRVPSARPGYRVVYVSPLKALAYDVERNLTAPLAELRETARGLGEVLAPVRIDVRSGDTPASDRRRQAKDPGDILITTPESLYLILGSAARAGLAAVEAVILDEIHAVAPIKRGAHLALSLERLSALVTGAGGADPQRIGLSATQRPLEVVARFLGGDRPVAVVDAGARPRLDLQIVVPAANMEAQHAPEDAPADQQGMWSAIYPRLLDLILAHRSTIVFCNSRRLAERLAGQLTELAKARGVAPAGEDLVRAHHGSVARHEREAIETALKRGQLRAITATSSLELGIDMGAVDLVVQIESPGGVARGLQRVGRADHAVGGTPKGRLLPTHRADLLEATAVVRGMRAGAVEPIALPESCLDVLAQQIVAMCGVEPWRVEDLDRVVRRAAGYAALTRPVLDAVLDMLSGRALEDELAELRPRLSWDREADVLTARRGARMLAVINGGTIPDRGLYAVHLGEAGPRIGELDEEMVNESRPGETFVLGASTWRIEAITRDRVIVQPAPGEPGKMPFWRGEAPGRPVALGRAVGALARELDAAIASGDAAAVTAQLRADGLDDHAIANLLDHVTQQRASSVVPTDRVIVVERFRDELGDWRVCILTPLGGRVHAPWALLLERQLEHQLGYPVHPLWTDDGIALRFADGDALPGDDDLLLDPERVADDLVAQLDGSAVFAARFREAAARALLLPRRRPGARTPLWTQRLRAQRLLRVALRQPSFPIVLEAYRECLRDVFDVPALVELLRAVHRREIRVEPALTTAASPFARGLVFDYVTAYLYEGDAPPAERRAQALTLDRRLLGALLGADELERLLDPEVVAEVEAELAGLAIASSGFDRRARDADELHDVLRRQGDLDDAELAARANGDVAAWRDQLAAQHRIVAVELAGTRRWIAAEDAARYRDALGTALPPEVPEALLASRPGDPLVELFARFARRRGPFRLADAATLLADRLGLARPRAEVALAALLERGDVVVLTPASGDGKSRLGRDAQHRVSGAEHDRGAVLCDAEVLRTLRRRTLVRLRREVEAVPAAQYARFLARWHDVGAGRRGPGALRDALARLEGVALPFAELEARILPARVADYAPRMLDELGASGELVWIGRGALGARDGRVILCRRDRAAALLPTPALDPAASPLHHAIVAHLRAAGASFLVAIEDACGREGVRAALWDLVWAGVVTNDTFAPLRSLRAPAGRRTSGLATFGGRWSLVEPLVTGARPTEIAYARARALLDRWGIASRGAAAADELPGGFAGILEVLRVMEDTGKVRRGHFVDGLDGSQVAWPAAVDALRAPRPDAVDVLPAADPANPWGGVLPWPATTDPRARPARRVGASVVLVDGACVLHVEHRRLISFAATDAQLERALRDGLPRIAALGRRRTLALETLDGQPVLAAPLTPVLERLGARRDYRGLAIAAV